MEEERPMIVDRDGGRSPGELRGEKAVGREETPLRRGLSDAIFDREPGASFTQAIFVTETLARACLKMDGTEAFRPGWDNEGHWEDTGDVPKKTIARVLRH